MKHTLFLSLIAAFPLLLSGAVAERAEDIRIEKGKVSAAYGETSTLFQDDFAKDTGKWKKPFRNHENFALIHYTNVHDVPALRIERNPKKEGLKVRLFDTAWGITTKRITLPAGANRWNLTIRAFSNQPEFVSSGGSRNFGNLITWFDKDGKRIEKDTRFFFNVADQFAAETRHGGKIPQGAAFAEISLGADTPDLQKGEYVAIAGVRFDTANTNVDFKKYCSFETTPVRNGNKKITWKADTPAGTAIKYQLAYASGKIPSKWSAFAGPDGTGNSWFTKQGFSADAEKGDWVKLKVRLVTAGKATPVVSSISVGDRTFSNWDGFTDAVPPVIVRVSTSPTEDASKPCVFKITDDNPVKWETLKILYYTDTIPGKAEPLNPEDITKNAVIKGDLVSVQRKGRFKNGLNFFRIEAEDLKGIKTQEDHVLFIGKRRTSNIVTMRDDGMTLVDGKPFFPIGMACAVKDKLNGFSYDRLFEMFEKAGMNFARHYSSYGKFSKDSAEYFAAAKKHNILLYCSAGRSANEKRIPLLAKTLVSQLDAPNIAWDTGDDTSMYITKDQMRLRYMAIKAIDPDRLTTQADPIGQFYSTRYRPYVLYSDNFSPEIYSVHNGSDLDRNQSVPTVISTMKAIRGDREAVGAPVRSCWPLIQYFYNCGNWARLPDYTELRAMTFQSVIHGAHGVIFYRYAGYRKLNKTGFTDKQWETVARVAKELRQVYDILCVRAAKDQPKVSVLFGPETDVQENCSVSVLLKEWNGKKYLFAGNGVRKPVKAKVTVPGAKSGKDVYTGRIFTAENDGSLAIELKPLEIFVICLSE